MMMISKVIHFYIWARPQFPPFWVGGLVNKIYTLCNYVHLQVLGLKSYQPSFLEWKQHDDDDDDDVVTRLFPPPQNLVRMYTMQSRKSRCLPAFFSSFGGSKLRYHTTHEDQRGFSPNYSFTQCYQEKNKEKALNISTIMGYVRRPYKCT